MHIVKDISNYIISEKTSLRDALISIKKNKSRTAFVVDNQKKVLGSLTDGDIRDYLIETNELDQNLYASTMMNPNFKSCLVGDSAFKINSLLGSRCQVLPLLDKEGEIKAIAKIKSNTIELGDFTLSPDHPCFIISEIGNNHNGDFELAKKLVRLSKEAGADCAKFQMRDLSSLYANKGNSSDASEDLGSQYTLDLLNSYSLKTEQMIELFDYCKEIGILPLCTPWDLNSLEVLENYGMPAYKIASADLNNHELLEAAAATGKPLLISTGMSTEGEILKSVELLDRLGAAYVLLHCNSTYPTPYKDIQLEFMANLKKLSGGLVGYSGHERGTHIPVAAVALGAKVVEKHFTIDKEMLGNDHKVSLLPNEFGSMVLQIRQLESAFSYSGSREVSQGELMNREILGKSIVLEKSIKEGELFTKEHLGIKSPGKGLPPYRITDILGQVAQRSLEQGAFLFEEDFKVKKPLKTNFAFDRPWGIPVRYHDFEKLSQVCNCDLVEFHYSYKDLELNPADFLKKDITTTMQMLVHSPELFENDHVLDLTSFDEEYRQESIKHLQRVIDVTDGLREYFPKTKRPLIITNVGGFSSGGFLTEEERKKKYELLEDSVRSLDMKGTEVIAQTMPPYPWHFGGQQYHNLFVGSDEIIKFCKDNKFRICFDISHSKLACNEFNEDWSDFVKKVAPYTAHLHISDAKGDNGEGLQVGEGDIDFASLSSMLGDLCPNASFIPEVWQGHKNNGQGFWEGLGTLEKWF